MKVKIRIFLGIVFILLCISLFSGNLVINISSENSKEALMKNFDLLKCETSACKENVEVFIKESNIKREQNRIIIENLKKGYYLLIPRKEKSSFYYFEKKYYKVKVPEMGASNITLKKLKGGGIVFKLMGIKEKSFIPSKSRFINVWFENKKYNDLFFRFEKIDKSEISIKGIPAGDFSVNFLCEGFGIKIIKDVKIVKGKITNLTLFFNKNSKTGIEGKIICGDIFSKEETISLVELLKKTNLQRYGVSFVDKNGEFKIIDVEPGKYKLYITIKSLNSKGQEVSLNFGLLDLKIKKNKILKITEVIDKKLQGKIQ